MERVIVEKTARDKKKNDVNRIIEQITIREYHSTNMELGRTQNKM